MTLSTGCTLSDSGLSALGDIDNTLDARLQLIHSNIWYRQAEDVIDFSTEALRKIDLSPGAAKNIILFVGDGMSISTVTAARILEGQNRGLAGEENFLSFGQFPFSGLVKTYNVDAQTPDSAGTMTAIMSGVKTDFGVLGVDQKAQRGNCESQRGNQLVSALMLAEIAGMSTGVISTSRITHATPAATYAVSVDRNWEDISTMPVTAVSSGCEDIALQLVNFEDRLESQYLGSAVDGLDVILGGGRRHFLPQNAADSDSTFVPIEHEVSASRIPLGLRSDGRNLIEEWQKIYKDGRYVNDLAGFSALDLNDTAPVLGLFNNSHMRYEADRLTSLNSEPSLTQMTVGGIKLLKNNPKGFFLVVEAGRIDHGHHAGSAFNALTDTIELSSAVRRAVALTNPTETLILVTADHGHVMSIAGYPRRGNPILGKVVSVGGDLPAVDDEGRSYTTLGYQNGRGFLNIQDATNADLAYDAPINSGRHDLTEIDTANSGFHQEAHVPLSMETHSGEDVAVYATGPGAHLATGTLEQSVIFHIMNYAADLTERARAAIK